MEGALKTRTHWVTRLLRPDTASMSFPILRQMPRDEQMRLLETWLRANPFEKSRRPPDALMMLCLSVFLMAIILAVALCVVVHLGNALDGVSRWSLTFLVLYVSVRLVTGPITRLGWRPYQEQFETFFIEYLKSRNESQGRL